MNKLFKIVLLVIFLLLFAGGNEASASTLLMRPEIRSTPLTREVNLKSGESDSVSVYVISNNIYSTATNFQMITKTNEKESYMLERKGFSEKEDSVDTYFGYHSNMAYVGMFYGEPGGSRKFIEYTLTNLSAGEVTFQYIVNTQIVKINDGYNWNNILVDMDLYFK